MDGGKEEKAASRFKPRKGRAHPVAPPMRSANFAPFGAPLPLRLRFDIITYPAGFSGIRRCPRFGCGNLLAA